MPPIRPIGPVIETQPASNDDVAATVDAMLHAGYTAEEVDTWLAQAEQAQAAHTQQPDPASETVNAMLHAGYTAEEVDTWLAQAEQAQAAHTQQPDAYHQALAQQQHEAAAQAQWAQQAAQMHPDDAYAAAAAQQQHDAQLQQYQAAQAQAEQQRSGLTPEETAAIEEAILAGEDFEL